MGFRGPAIGAAMALGLVSVGAPAAARIIVQTGAPTGVCGQCAWSLNGSQWLAARIHVAAPTTIDWIDGFIAATSGHGFTIALLSDGGAVPGGLIDSATAKYNSHVQWQGLHNLAWAVKAGYYWVAFEVTGPDDLVGGSMAYPAPHPLKVAAITEGGTFIPDDTLDFGLRVLRIPDVKAAEFKPSAVPEPATWATLLAGLLGLGALLRVRRRKSLGATAPTH